MSDEIINGQYRGWADRVADELSKHVDEFHYANHAIRGKLLPQVIEDQIPHAISQVTGRETLFSFHAGANDALRRGFDSELAKKRYQAAVREIAKSGATVMLFAVLEDAGNKGKAAKIWKERFSQFNLAIREVAEEVGAILLDPNNHSFFRDNRFLAFDRLHLNPEGHFRTAHAILEKLQYPCDPSWRVPLPPKKKWHDLARSLQTLPWIFVFAIPWILRRLQGKSSGDGRSAKYPQPTKWPK